MIRTVVAGAVRTARSASALAPTPARALAFAPALTRPWAIAALVALPLLSPLATQAQARTGTHRSSAQEVSTPTPMERWVKLDFDNAPLDKVLHSISQQSRLDITFFENMITGKKVTVHAESIAVYSALQMVLRGTGLKANVLPSGNVSIVSAAEQNAQTGVVEGTVIDTTDNTPIVGARVALAGTPYVLETDKNGHFRFGSVPPGTYLVRITRLGFLARQVTVVVRDGATANVTVRMHVVNTRLTDVVTTATGNQERLKVGNDVGTINADSLVRTELVRNVSDILTARIPGVQATPTGGAVGAPTKIRIRGVTSSQLNNDPIVVIDGVRVNAQTTANTISYLGTALNASQVNTGSTALGRNGLSPAAAPSPLDQIDPNMIESIDVLKGPTATALYGPDASTGVIVIKTKSGRPGPWRYHIGGDYGLTVPLKDYPLNYAAWGHTPGGGLSQPGCNLLVQSGTSGSQGNGGCVLDSVTAFNPQNDPQMTNLATATNKSIVMDASGGGSTVQGFLQGDYSSDIGQQKLSDVEQRRLERMWSTPIPSWMIRPNQQTNGHATAKVQALFSPQFDVSLSGEGTYQLTLNDGTGVSGAQSSAYGPGDTLAFLPAENLRGRNTSSTKRGVGTAIARYQPISWLVLTGNTGLDYSMRDDEALTRSLDCTLALNPSGCSSSHSATRTEVLVPSFTTGATFTYNFTKWLGAHTALGEQYSRTQTYIMGVSASNLSFGSSVITGAGSIGTPTEATDASASAGWYAEQEFDIDQLLFLTAALRRDASSSFGQATTTPTFPKYGASWLVSQEPFFPHQNVVTQLRLRSAYGESGKQGSQSDVLPNYTFATGFANGATIPILIYSGVGNSELQPQRDKEWEGGFDLSFYNDRATVTATWYKKSSHNAIISINLPPSPGVAVPIQSANVGDITNNGYELQLSIRPVDTKFVTWDFNMAASSNTNKLVRGSGIVANNSGGRIVQGYPLFGLWERPILSYGDYNHNGILDYNEIVFGDSLAFVGSTDPKGSYNYSNSLTFLGGRLRVNSLISQIRGLATTLSGVIPLAAVDTTAGIAQQAAYLQAFGTPYYRGGASGYMGIVSYVNFQELSFSYTLPDLWARRLHSTAATFTVAGRNLGLWTNYRGADPTTNTAANNGFGDAASDNGAGLAQPREWVFRLNLQF